MPIHTTHVLLRAAISIYLCYFYSADIGKDNFTMHWNYLHLGIVDWSSQIKV